MTFEILNSTGGSVTFNGVSYANGAWVDITNSIAFQGIKYTRNDVDGPNAGRAINGKMIRDRVATKAKWNITMVTASAAADVQAVMALVYPEVFYVRTDMPTGTMTTYEVYSNNIPVQYLIYKDGIDYYQGVTIPVVEM